MYRDLGCQHDLVQERNDQRPDIPGLTPVGFERWVTLLIQAHPEEKYRRLQRALQDMPISNPDKKERFPKQISRRLFPQYEDRGIREHIEYCISKNADIQLPRRANRKEPQVRRDSPFHTSSADKQIRNPQNHRRRRVSFVLPTDNRSNSRQHFDEPAYTCTERARRLLDEDVGNYGESPRRYECADSDDKRPLRRFDRYDYTNDDDGYRIN